MNFKKYRYIDESLSNKKMINNITSLKLLKANELFQMENYKSSKIIIDEILDDLLLNETKLSSVVLNTLIKLSVLLGDFCKIIKIINKNNLKLLDLKEDFFYIEVISNYFKFLKINNKYPINYLNEKANNSTKKGFLYYILFLTCKNEDYSKDFLKISLHEEPLNLSAIYELIDLGEEINSKSLKFALEVENDLFNKLSYKKNEEEIMENEKLNVEVFTLGGGDTVGGSCYIISFNEVRIMIDAGAILSKENKIIYPDFQFLEEKYKDIFKELDYLLITHGHLDHCGAILEVYKKNPKIKILMTEETREILRANLISGNLSFEEEMDLDTCLSMVTVIKCRQALNLKCKDNTFLNIEFFRAGHILGASSIYINNKDVGIFVTGDYCLNDQETIKGMDIPKDYKIDLLITETTYGNKIDSSLTSRNYEKQKLIYTVKEALKNGKKVLIPAFSIGRSQEIISILKDELNACDNERLYIDGMVMRINEIYEKFLCVNYKGNNMYTFKNGIYDTKHEFINQEILNNKSCVVVSSGMLQKGSAVIEYAINFLKRKDCVCILTGYQAENTIGSNLKSQINIEGDRYISIDGELINIQCQLEEAKLSAHCTIEEILTLILKLKPKKVLLVHGNARENQSYIYKILSKCKDIEVIQSKNKANISI